MQVRLLKDGNLLAIKPVDPPQLSDDLRRRLEHELVYKRLVFLHGEGRPGSDQAIKSVSTDLYYYDRLGRMITNTGFLERIQGTLKQAGCRWEVKNLRPLTKQQKKARTPYLKRLEQFNFLYKQREVVDCVIKEDHAVFDCPTGWGKSFIIRVCATLFPYAKIHVITKSADVIGTFYDELRSVLPDVGLQGAGRKLNGRRVQLYCAGSLHHSAFDADFVFCDEIHELATESILPRLAAYRFSKMFCFTASHNQRLDGADYELEGLFGPVRVKVSYKEGVAHKMIVPIHVQWVPVQMDQDPGEGAQNKVAIERQSIWRNQHRNQIIADVARRFTADEQVLIVCEKIEHAVLLKKLLPEFTLCYGENGMKPGQRWKYIRSWQCFTEEDEPVMTPVRRQWLRHEFSAGRLKKVIATSVWNRGVDFRPLSVLIRADAGGSPINDTQIPGRVSRNFPDKKAGLLIDFLDLFSPRYRRRSQSRRNSYTDKGWEQSVWGGQSRSFQNYLA